jgi:glycosyltransferase involved in cell wall biosynthesis
VIDDGSGDQTPKAIMSFGDRVRYVRTAHAGTGAARNRGVREATGQTVAFLDSDDEWMPGKVELARGLLAARPDVLFLFSDFAVTDAVGAVQRRHLIHWHRDARSWDEILGPGVPYSRIAPLPPSRTDFPVHVGSLYAQEIARPYVLTSSMVARRVEAGDALHFAEDVPTYEDLECFGRLSHRGPAAFLDYETAWQHGHSDDRLGAIDGLRQSTASIVILERVWGADAVFLREHGELYRRVLDEQRRVRVKALVLDGRVGEAREEARRLWRVTRPLRFALRCPRVARSLVRRRRAVRLIAARSRKSS